MREKTLNKDGETLTMLEQFSRLRRNSINGVADAGNDHIKSITELEDTHNPDQPIKNYNQAGEKTAYVCRVFHVGANQNK